MDFLQELGGGSDKDFSLNFKPQTDIERNDFAAYTMYIGVLKDITLGMFTLERENIMTIEIYNLLKNFSKDISIYGLRDLRREIKEEIHRLYVKLGGNDVSIQSIQAIRVSDTVEPTTKE